MRTRTAASTASLVLLAACSSLTDSATAPRLPATADIGVPHPTRVALPIDAAQRQAARLDQARLARSATTPPTHAQPTAAERAPRKDAAQHRPSADDLTPPRPNLP